MRAFIFAAMLIISAPCLAQSWDITDKTLATAAVTALAIDWGQTRYISKHPEYYETNPLLGRHPSTGKVDAYFATAVVGTLVIANVLPRNYRKYFLGGVTAVEIGYAAHNANLGLRISF